MVGEAAKLPKMVWKAQKRPEIVWDAVCARAHACACVRACVTVRACTWKWSRRPQQLHVVWEALSGPREASKYPEILRLGAVGLSCWRGDSALVFLDAACFIVLQCARASVPVKLHGYCELELAPSLLPA